MKKFVSLFLALLMVMSLAACGAKEEPETAAPEEAEKDTLVIAINATFPPFEAIDDGTDSYTGIDIDLANAIGEKLGMKVEFNDMQFSALVPTLQSGRADLIVSGISPTAERKEVLDFSDSYYFPMNAIICKEGAGLDTLAALEGKSIGVSLGTSYAEIAHSVADAEVKELDSTPLVIQEILNDRCAAGIFDATQAVEFVASYEGLESYIIETDISMEDTFAIAAPKDSPYLEQINTILAEMLEDGTFHDILVKHLGEEATAQYEEMVAGLNIEA